MPDKLTLAIPTRNRPAFICRALEYYASVACPYPILVGDSSDPDPWAATEEWIQREIGGRLKICHLKPGSSAKKPAGWQTDPMMKNFLEEVRSPYVAFYADDDFAVVRNFGAAIDWMGKYKETSFVCGDALIFTLRSEGERGVLRGMACYHQQSVPDTVPSRRLRRYFEECSVLEYGVSRTAQFKERWEKVFSSGADNLLGELIQSALVAVQGKVKKMNALFIVRQAHEGMTSNKNFFDWLVSPEFSAGWQSLSRIVGEALREAEGLSAPAAEAVVKEHFWGYLQSALSRKLEKKRSLNLRGKLAAVFGNGRFLLPPDFKPVARIVQNGRNNIS